MDLVDKGGVFSMLLLFLSMMPLEVLLMTSVATLGADMVDGGGDGGGDGLFILIYLFTD